MYAHKHMYTLLTCLFTFSTKSKAHPYVLLLYAKTHRYIGIYILYVCNYNVHVEDAGTFMYTYIFTYVFMCLCGFTSLLDTVACPYACHLLEVMHLYRV